jgi:hypothetical protein
MLAPHKMRNFTFDLRPCRFVRVMPFFALLPFSMPLEHIEMGVNIDRSTRFRGRTLFS